MQDEASDTSPNERSDKNFPPALRLDTVHEWHDDRLRSLLADADVSEVEVPLPMVGFAQDPTDGALDYLAALYAAERLSPLGARPPATERRVESRRYASGERVVHFHLTPAAAGEGKLDELCHALRTLSRMFSEDDAHEEDRFDLTVELGDLRNTLLDSSVPPQLNFPQLADRFMAYAMASRESETTLLSPDTTVHPEWSAGYWCSFAAANAGLTAFVSFGDWVVPHGEDLGAVLACIGGFEDGAPEFLPATTLVLDRARLLFHETAACPLPVEHALEKPRALSDVLLGPPSGFKDSAATNREISEDGDVFVFTDQRARYVFFPRRHEHSTVADVYNQLAEAAQTLGKLAGIRPVSITLPWNRLDDEAFEQLCYDVLTASERYDGSSVRKMGKSRSRDGGRDLIVLTRAAAWEIQKRIIVQCKLLPSDRSLGASHLNIVDTVEAYGAEGYCIMTSGYVDATLHDRLSAFDERKGWHVDTWSHMELERLIARRPDIRTRYFE